MAKTMKEAGSVRKSKIIMAKSGWLARKAKSGYQQ